MRLGQAQSRQRHPDEIDDANRMMEELGAGASFEDCNAWWKTRGRKADAAQCKAPDMSAFDAPDTNDYSIKPKIGAESEQIVVHGQVVWPNDSGRYSFDEAWRAFHLWQDLDRSLAQTGDSPSARGRFFMQLKAWMEGSSHGFAVAWHKISAAQHNHPDKASETKAPSRHFNAQ